METSRTACRATIALLGAALLNAPPAIAQTAQPAPTGAPINRPMDIWPGVIFVCVPEQKLAWSFPACEQIGKEAQRLAEAGKVRLAIAGTPRAPADVNEAARQAGFDGQRALSVVARFTSGADAGSNLALQATSRADANPGVTQPLYRTVYSQSAILRQGATARDAATTGKTMLEGLFETFLKPVKR
jgi:hypothetical protein